MTILLCNDDGIQAPGIHALKRAVDGLGEILVVAPDGERSAISHGITLTKPLYTRAWPSAEEPFGLAVSGTPADCVKLAANCLFAPPPELVLSGINLGPNAGISVLYSGTVSAATESVIMGIPALAFSLDTFTDPQWETAVQVCRAIVGQVVSGRLAVARDLFWNVNIPNVPLKDIRGLRVTRLGESRFIEKYEKRLDPWGNPYYWMRGDLKEMGDMAGTDLEALREGYVSLSPVGLDRTSHAALDTLAADPPVLGLPE